MRSKKTGAPPVPPQRHSSMRTPSITPGATPPGIMNTSNNNNNNNNSNYSQNNSGNSVVSRLVTDLESKFGKRFHNVTEFPAPPPFLNIQKMYPSRNAVKATNAPPVPSAPTDAPRKQRAPAPPIQAKINAYAQQQMENQQW